VNALTFIAPLTLAIVVCEIIFPGREFYHAGWFNVALAALVVLCLLSSRKPFRAASDTRRRAGVAAVAFGAAIVGFAGVASGLLAPDSRTIVGAPGASVRVDELGGTLSFPLVEAAGTVPDVLLTQGGRTTAIGSGSHDIGTFIVREIQRDVIYVAAADRRGARLTVTQPNGATFLSPVLLMQQRQKIPETNLDLPYDAFAVPAAHRNVKAVLFSAQQAAMLHPTAGVAARAILFAVDDEDDRPLPGSIALAREGQDIELAGLRLRGDVLTYPAIEFVAVPSLVALILGAVVMAGGWLALVVRERSSRAQ
jgi:hypothetical protein